MRGRNLPGARFSGAMTSRLKPHHIVRLIGVGVALFTFASYLVPFWTDFDEASSVTR